MDFGSIFLILSLAVIVVLFVSQPLIMRRPATTQQGQRQARAEDHDRSALLAERDRLLLALQDLDFDNTLEKIPAEDYPVQRTALLQAGADVLRRLEAMGYKEDLQSPKSAAGTPVQGRKDWSVASEPDDELEEMIAAYRKERQEKSAGFCPKCGKPVRKSDRFCARCGTDV
jgi:NADH pyrophosphatase NudC (nudix superfamily)